MSAEIPVKVGDKIPLQAQETNGATDKVIRATVYNFATFAVVAGPITLAHQTGGAYKDDSVTMPDIELLYAQYLVFDSDGTTPNTTGEKAVHDLFAKDTLDDAVSDLKTAVRSSDLVAEISDGGQLEAQISSDDQLSAEVLENELTATVSGDDTLGAQVDGGENLQGEV